jgi:hypothetical protein
MAGKSSGDGGIMTKKAAILVVFAWAGAVVATAATAQPIALTAVGSATVTDGDTVVVSGVSIRLKA